MTEEKFPGSKYVNVLADNICNNNNNNNIKNKNNNNASSKFEASALST
jgi:hypothetical protein